MIVALAIILYLLGGNLAYTSYAFMGAEDTAVSEDGEYELTVNPWSFWPSVIFWPLVELASIIVGLVPNRSKDND